jgi:hypothetical protein
MAGGSTLRSELLIFAFLLTLHSGARIVRVTIDHRQQTTGLGSTQSQFVECTVQFSEEEKAIIAVRGLYDHLIVLDNPRPPPSYREYMTAGILLAFTPLIALVGFATLAFAIANNIFSGGQNGGGYIAIGAVLFFGAPIGWAVGFLMDRAMSHRFTHPKQFITIREMLLRPFVIHSPDPAYSDLIVDQIKERLAILKAIITGSAELREKQTYEL